MYTAALTKRECLRRTQLLPDAKHAHDLIAFLGAMSINAAPQLNVHVHAGPWPGADAKFVPLGLIDGAIAALREKRGLLPFDNTLPDEPPSAFLEICEVLA